MKSTISLGEYQSLIVEPHESCAITMTLYVSKKAPLPDLMLGLNRDQAEALVLAIKLALENKGGAA
mgnify:CR=1 FL=1|jgi:hypothetical protein